MSLPAASATGLRLVDPGPRQPVLRWVVELLPAYLVALAILPWVIAHGVAWPWQPSTIDLQVYVYAVQDMLAGKDIYATTTPFWNLYFIYPPIAAVLMVPLAVGPYWFWQLVWTFLLIWAQQSVMKRCGCRGAGSSDWRVWWSCWRWNRSAPRSGTAR